MIINHLSKKGKSWASIKQHAQISLKLHSFSIISIFILYLYNQQCTKRKKASCCINLIPRKIQQHTYAVNSISPKFPHIYIYTKCRIQTIQVKHTIYQENSTTYKSRPNSENYMFLSQSKSLENHENWFHEFLILMAQDIIFGS